MRRSILAGRLLGTVALLALAAMPAAPALAQPGAAAARTAPAARQDGFIPFTHDAARGRVLMEIPAFDQDVLYYVSLASGGGSVEMSFDRGIVFQSVVRFQRAGGRVIVEQQNTGYKALGGGETAAGVTASFPTSVLAALPIESEGGGRVIVDATPLFMRDAGGVEAAMRRANQGAFRFDAGRSSFFPARMKAFPDNTEIETIATFTADNPGALIRNVAPTAGVVSMHVHHSFLKAPTGYQPRVADPRIGVSTQRFHDFSKPLSESPETEWITRWRLEKKNPGAAMSDPVKPITFYFDPAIPDDLRHAMKQGFLWWGKSFEAAGFSNAVQALDAPADMDPMDIRYAYVLWINRDERGFSSGGTYRDIRTGEILGAKVRMDSHRVRTVGNYWDAYKSGLPQDGSGITIADPGLLTPGALAGLPAGQRDMILTRQALLTAHELGHSIGFQHNWASSLNNRASVMEYPTPRVKVTNGRLDLSEAFQKEIGAYDTMMVRYAYTDFPKDREKAGLDGVIADMRAQGLLFVPDTDPRWTWYDDRATPTEAMREALDARRIMLATYGQNALTADEPVGSLRDARLWMVYLHPRYQIEAAQKYIGGMFQNIVVRGDTVPPTEFIPASLQRDTLSLLMQTIDPAQLAMPESLLAQLTTDPGVNHEDMSGTPVFDQLNAARILSAMVLEPLFAPDKSVQMIALAARQPDTLTFPEMVGAVMKATWGARDGSAGDKALRRVSQGVALQSMMMLGGSDKAAPDARAYVLDQLATLSTDLKARRDADPLMAAHYRQSARDIDHYLEDPAKNAPKTASPAWGTGPRSRFPQPPGPPLG